MLTQIASRVKLSKEVMAEQREAEEELAVFMNQRLVKEVRKRTAAPLHAEVAGGTGVEVQHDSTPGIICFVRRF